MSTAKKGGKGKAGGNTQAFLQLAQEKVPEQWQQYQPDGKEKPEQEWAMEYVYGFSGDRVKSALHFGSNNNEILYRFIFNFQPHDG